MPLLLRRVHGFAHIRAVRAPAAGVVLALVLVTTMERGCADKGAEAEDVSRGVVLKA